MPWIRLLLFLLATALPAQADRTVALQNGSAPNTGGGTFGTLFAPATNDAGAVAFRALVSGGSGSQGVFLDTGSGPALVALNGATAPDTGGGTYNLFGEPAINASGQVAFSASILGGTATWGLFRYDSGVVTALATSQTTAPGTGGGNYSAFGDRIAINASGEVAFFANVGSGTTTGGIFVEDGTSGSAIFLFGDPVPAGVAGTYFNVSDPALNDAGEVAVVASILLTAGGSTSAVVAARTGGDAYAALIGDSAPSSGGGTYSAFNFSAPPSIDGAGDVYFRSNVTGGTTARGIFVDAAGTDAAVVLQGDPAPDAGGTFNFLSDSGQSVNDSGDVGFSANLLGASSAQGLFVSNASLPSEALVLLGDVAPDTGGATFLILGDSPSINGTGGAAYRGFYSGAANGWGVFFLPEPSGPAAWVTSLGLLSALRRRQARAR